jgi:hypothetical protein
MTEPTPETPCPDWCEMHVDGRHVGALELAATIKNHNVYVRPLDYGGGETGLEVVVAVPDTEKTIRVEIEPGKVTESAWMADLQRSITALENGEPIDGPQ